MTVPWEALVAIGIYIITSTIGFVWWMATITVRLEILSKAVEKMALQEEIYVKKEDMAKEFSWRDKKMDAAWQKLDTLKSNA